MDAVGIAGWFFSLVTGSVLLTWLYNESRGSILVVALFHAAVAVAFTSDISSQYVVNAAGGLITFWGIVVLVATGPGYLSRRGKVVRLHDGGTVTDFVHRDRPVAPTAAGRSMLLNRLEAALMNNPVRALIQRRVEAPRLARMGGRLRGGTALEIGCGRGVGAEAILDVFGAQTVHGFDLDPRAIARARRRLAGRGGRARFWVGDAAAIAAPDQSYDAVFDFGVLHHLPQWRLGLAETCRVLRPAGCLYAEEVLASLVRQTRCFLAHPQEDRFDAAGFQLALADAGFQAIRCVELAHSVAWFVAIRGPAA